MTFNNNRNNVDFFSSRVKGVRYGQKAQIPYCPERDRLTLAEWANSISLEWRLVERARIIRQNLSETTAPGPISSNIARTL